MTRRRSCRRCNSRKIQVVERWDGFAIVWQTGDTADDGDGEVGNPVSVFARCLNCKHEWNLRGVTQVTPDLLRSFGVQIDGDEILPRW